MYLFYSVFFSIVFFFFNCIFGCWVKHLKWEPSSYFHALPNHTLYCSSGPDRKPYKNILCFLVFYPLVITFDSLSGFILVVAGNMIIYTHILSICSFPTSSKPSALILIVINSDSAVLRQNMGCHQKCDIVH